MKLPRRTFLHLAAGAAALPAVPRFAWGQSYPSRPVRIVVTFPAGSTSDILARPMAQWLQERPRRSTTSSVSISSSRHTHTHTHTASPSRCPSSGEGWAEPL
jgi:tripartite-type tricarboxylate transporter receptor subunit TctC